MLKVTSAAFEAKQPIPVRFTCEGDELSPPLQWSGAPAGTRRFAILVEDPDAPGGTFLHWLLVDVPAEVTSLPAGAALPTGAIACRYDRGRAGWAGPCPPSGRHRYVFRVYALDAALGRALDRRGFLDAIEGHVLDQGELIGTYEKQPRRAQPAPRA